ncbi:hypothetical protein GQ457_09G017170 [Hibiscus cannabinus]
MCSKIHTHRSHVMYFFEEPSLQLELFVFFRIHARNDQPGRIKQQYLEVILFTFDSLQSLHSNSREECVKRNIYLFDIERVKLKQRSEYGSCPETKA